MKPLITIDQFCRVAPGRIRFRDEATCQFVKDGLEVTAYPIENPERRVPILCNDSADYVLINLPGLGRFEHSSGTPKDWNDALAHPKEFIIEVLDTFGRFIPVSFSVKMPILKSEDNKNLGLFYWEDATQSPPQKTPYIPLYSAPKRQTPAGLCAVRASLRETGTGDVTLLPVAPWTLVEAVVHGRVDKIVRGISDINGNLAMVFSYPELPLSTLGSPPAASGGLGSSQWQINLSAFYKSSTTLPVFCDLKKTLTQLSARLIADENSLSLFTTETISFGKDCVLKSNNQSVLFITPAA